MWFIFCFFFQLIFKFIKVKNKDDIQQQQQHYFPVYRAVSPSNNSPRSIENKIEEILNIIKTILSNNNACTVDLIAITEHWIKNDNYNK